MCIKEEEERLLMMAYNKGDITSKPKTELKNFTNNGYIWNYDLSKTSIAEDCEAFYELVKLFCANLPDFLHAKGSFRLKPVADNVEKLFNVITNSRYHLQ